MSHTHGHGQGHGQTQRHVQLKMQLVEAEQRDSEALEAEEAFDATFAVGASNAPEPRFEDEQVRDEADENNDTSPGSADEDEQPVRRSWARRALLRSRAPVVVVRLRVNGKHAEPVSTLAPSHKGRPMLENLCAFLRDRFGAAAREKKAIPDEKEWHALLGLKPAGPIERLALLARLAVTGEHKFDRSDGGTADGNDLGLGHYLYKFAALPDGMPFSIRLLLAGGKKRAKKTADEDDPLEFDRLPDGVQLVALNAALRRERAENDIRFDKDFAKLLRTETATILGGASVPAISADAVARFRDKLKKHGCGHLFPKTSDRKKAANGGGA